jgi:hypothetical protein
MLKVSVDNSNYLRNTEYPMRDSIFNAVVKRYGVKGNHWKRSDDMVWGGALYHVLDYFFMILFVYFVYIVANFTYNRYGVFKAAMVIVVMALIRLNALIRKVDLTNRLLKKQQEK